MKQAHLGVIETLSLGFTLVARHFLILLLPIVLDLYLWWGPRLSPLPLLRPALELMGLPRELRLEYLAALERIDLRELLVPGVLGMPSLLARGEPIEATASSLEITSPSIFMGAVLLLVVGGLFLAALYWGFLAQRIQNHAAGKRLLAQILVWWARVALFGLLVFLASFFLGFPVALLIFLVSAFDQGLATLFALAILLITTAVWFYLFFTIDAIFIGDIGPLRAMGQSITLVRSHFWPSAGLILVITFLASGLHLAFRALSFHPWGTAVGILANAYVGSALAAATLIFYGDRLGKIKIQAS
ncbi:MAG: hypothetical protein HYX86_02545 [Chloroflexi bacterium]|nr:hypothetical protein [Chloroflexota bacterium]